MWPLVGAINAFIQGLLTTQIGFFRNINSYVEYSADNSTWIPISLICKKVRNMEYSASVSANTWYTVGTASGAGRLNMVHSVSTAAYPEIEITIDGVVQPTILGTSIASGFGHYTGQIDAPTTTVFGPFEFTSSLQIRARMSSSGTLNVKASYGLV